MKPGIVYKTKKGLEYAVYPGAYLRITQDVNGLPSHVGTLNWDEGLYGRNNVVYAPAEMILKRVIPNFNGGIYWSKNKCLLADGTIDYFSLLAYHTNEIGLIAPLGRVYKQGEIFYKEGGKGPQGPHQYANHIHFSVAKGHTTSVGSKGNLKGAVLPSDVFFINDTIVKDGKGHVWKTYTEPLILPGSIVKIIGTHYATGQKIPLWVKLRSHTVKQMNGDGSKVLLKEINSWVYAKDVVLK